MEKEQIVSKLTEMGHKAVLDGNVIMCTLNSQKAVRGLKYTLRGLFYNGSWGYRIRKDAENETETICSRENSGELSDCGNAEGDMVLPHEESSQHSSFREHREQTESNGSLQDDESEHGSIEETQIEGQMSIMDWFG